MSQLAGEAGRLALPALVLHGGAGTFERVESARDGRGLEEALGRAVAAGWVVLDRPGADPLDAVVAAVVSMEDSGLFNAGRGAVPTTDGTIELDASVMDWSGRVGAVAGARYPANPVLVAKAVAEMGGLPDGPILLGGDGADMFARRSGARGMRPSGLTGRGESPPGPAHSAQGTVGAVAVDRAGHVAAATSTGGRSGQLRGRIGDTPIPGAGVFADGSTVAVSATGTGEVFIVTGFSHRVDWALKAGASVQEAVDAALELVALQKGQGGCVAVTPTGEFAARFNSRAMARAFRDPNGQETRIL
jgi:isoaspartyl peptidase/L-asparaginase-like protein (Ntn-hydrolase superfamily)